MYLGVNNGSTYRFYNEFIYNGEEYFVLYLDNPNGKVGLKKEDFVIRKYEDEEEYLDVEHYFNLTEIPYNNFYEIEQLEDLIKSSLKRYFEEDKNADLGILNLYIKALNNYGKAIFKYLQPEENKNILCFSIYWKNILYKYYYNIIEDKLIKI